MEFTVEFYVSGSGACPVEEFLADLLKTDESEHDIVSGKILRLKHVQSHKEPLTKALGEGLFELRHLGKLNTRIIWFFRRGRRIILVHGIRNKSQKIQTVDIQVALHRMKDWIERNS